MAEKKFSQLTAKGATIADTDLVAISESAGGGTYTTKSVTGANIKGLVTDANLTTTDITTNDVSTAKHGFAPKAPNDATKYLDGTGAWSTPASGSSGGRFGIADSAGTYTYYTTLGAAITAATAGQTIEFFTDYTETGATVVTLKDGVNINGNGHTYTKTTNDSTNAFEYLTGTGTFNINNLFITRTTGTGHCIELGINTATINFTGTQLRATGGGKALYTGAVGRIINLTAISTTSATALHYYASGNICNFVNCMGINTSSGIGISSNAGGYFNNCYGESSSGFGISGGQLQNCVGYSISNAGIYTPFNAFNCVGRSSTSIGLDTTNSIRVELSSGISSSGYGIFVGGTYISRCVGISSSNFGLFTGTGPTQVYNCDGYSASSVGGVVRHIAGRLIGGKFQSDWNNAGGRALEIGDISSISRTILLCTNASANNLYSYQNISRNVKIYQNTFIGGAGINANLTNTMVNTEDTYGNITE